jgi:T5orf172 domain
MSFICSFCEDVFKSNYALKKHINHACRAIFVEKQSYKICPYCQFEATNNWNCKLHMKICKHKPEELIEDSLSVIPPQEDPTPNVETPVAITVEKPIEAPTTTEEVETKDEGFIYLLHTREFCNTYLPKPVPIYKIGYTKQDNPEKRFKQYPKGYQIIFYTKCMNPKKAEALCLTVFDKEFKRMTEYGLEYFKGDYGKMIQVICTTLYEQQLLSHYS